MNGLTFGALASVLLGNFDFIRLKPDRTRTRSKCSNKPSPFAVEPELLTASRADRLRFSAAYLITFTLKEVKQVVCRSSEVSGLPIRLSQWIFIFRRALRLLFTLFCGHRLDWGMRHSLPYWDMS
jgi:hypothetical protein